MNLQKIVDFVKGGPSKTSIEEHVRKKSFEEEKIRLATERGKQQARELYEKKKQSSVQNKINWEKKLQGIADGLDDTFKPTTKPIKLADSKGEFDGLGWGK